MPAQLKAVAPQPRGLRLLKPKQCCERLGCGPTKFWEDYIGTGMLRLTETGHCPEHEVDAVIEKIIAERDAKAKEPNLRIAKMVAIRRAKREAQLLNEQSGSPE
jgi:hypothetical protein